MKDPILHRVGEFQPRTPRRASALSPQVCKELYYHRRHLHQQTVRQQLRLIKQKKQVLAASKVKLNTYGPLPPCRWCGEVGWGAGRGTNT